MSTPTTTLGQSTFDEFPASTATVPGPPQHGVREYIWQLPVRITHWLIALSIVVLSITGFAIGHPFLVVPGEARFAFVMGILKAVHFYSAIVFTLSVLARIAWMFVGNRFASWREFLPVSRRRWRLLVGTLRFYLFLDRQPPTVHGHNPLAGLAYFLVFCLYLLEIATGLALYSVNAHVDSWMGIFGSLLPWLGGAQTARWLHHIVMWLLLGFAVHHIYSAWLVTIVEKNATMDSIFSGYKIRRE